MFMLIIETEFFKYLLLNVALLFTVFRDQLVNLVHQVSMVVWDLRVSKVFKAKMECLDLMVLLVQWA